MSLEDRVEKAEDDLRPQSDGCEYITINIRYVETEVNQETGEKREIRLPAQYSEDVPYGERFWHPDRKRWMRIRTRYPIEETHGIVPDEVTK
jgi:hypothetical protein